jgi:hypothetical protein
VSSVTIASIAFACMPSGALLLILEMDRPLEGMTKVSSAPLEKALDHLGR